MTQPERVPTREELLDAIRSFGAAASDHSPDEETRWRKVAVVVGRFYAALAARSKAGLDKEGSSSPNPRGSEQAPASPAPAPLGERERSELLRLAKEYWWADSMRPRAEGEALAAKLFALVERLRAEAVARDRERGKDG